MTFFSFSKYNFLCSGEMEEKWHDESCAFDFMQSVFQCFPFHWCKIWELTTSGNFIFSHMQYGLCLAARMHACTSKSVFSSTRFNYRQYLMKKVVIYYTVYSTTVMQCSVKHHCPTLHGTNSAAHMTADNYSN